MLERPGATSQPLPPEQTIADVFAEEGGSLLLLGEPGSGKTTILLELARALLARSERDPGLPIPVVFNLSSWVEPQATIIDWLADELSAKYQIPKKIGRAWLGESRLLPLLDGLDELLPDRRAACVQAINAFTQAAGLTGVVVCCRLREYIDLPVRLMLNAAIRLQPLTDEQVMTYLAAAGDRLAALQTALQRDSAMRIDARSPLMLNLMVRAYQDLTVAEVMSEGDRNHGPAAQTVDGSLCRAHVPACWAKGNGMNLRPGPVTKPYSEAQTRHWLAFLARNMQRHGQTIFLIEQIQPSWLERRWQRWIYILVSRLLWGFMAGVISWLIFGLLAYFFGYGWFEGLHVGLYRTLSNGLVIWLSLGLGFGLIGGFSPGVREMKTRPNEGFRLSIRNGLVMGSVAGLIMGLLFKLLTGEGLVYGVFSGVCTGLWRGGFDLLQHGILRILFYFRGDAPLNYACFLDYAAEELNFLQKVGGGYVFIHRYLLEHFAAMEEAVETGQPRTPTNTSAAGLSASDVV